MLEPLEPLAPLGLMGDIPYRRRRAAPEPEPLTREEEQTLLGKATGALTYLGESLSKLGYGARGLLAGRPEELLHMIPFSDTLGITDRSGWFGNSLFVTDRKTEGRDLLEQYAGAPQNQAGLFNDPEDFLWDVAGFGVDVLTDPLNLVVGPGAAVTKRGLAKAAGSELSGLAGVAKHADEVAAGAQAAGKILGTTPVAMANEIRAGERGLAALKIPFAKSPFATLGAGSERAAKLVEKIYYGKYSPVVPLRTLFSKTVGGIEGGTDVATGLAHMARDRAYSDLVNAGGMVRDAAVVLEEHIRPLRELWGDIAKHAKDSGDDLGFESADELLRYLFEQESVLGKQVQDGAGSLANVFRNGNLKDADAFSKGAHDVLKTMGQVKDTLYEKFRDLGGIGEWLDDAFIHHFPRRPAKPEYARQLDQILSQVLLPTGTPFASSRNEIFRHMPGGTVTLNRISRDPLVSATRGADKEALAGLLRDKLRVLDDTVDPETLGKMGIPELQSEYVLRKYIEPELAAVGESVGEETAALALRRFREGLPKGTKIGAQELAEDQAAILPTLVKYFNGLDPAALETGLFNRTIMADWMDYAQSLSVSTANLRGIHHLLHQTANSKPVNENWVSLTEAWRGVRTPEGKRLLKDRGLRTFLEDHAKQSKEFAEAIAGKSLDDMDVVADLASSLFVDPRTAQVAGLYLDLPGKEGTSWLRGVMSSYTAASKAGWTIPFPAFHGRNYIDGQWRNYMRVGPQTYSLKQLVAAQRDLWKHGGNVDELKYGREFLDQNLLGGHTFAGDLATEGAGLPKSAFEAVTAPFRKGYYDDTVGAWDKWSPLNTRGVRNEARAGQPGKYLRGSKQNALMEAGTRSHQYVEFLNRYAPYQAAREAGMSPSQAAHLVLEIQYDYGRKLGGAVKGNFSDTVMKKVFPFWDFLRNNIPYQIGQLINRPGGGHAWTLRLMSKLSQGQDQKSYVPDWLKERTAIRLGGPEEEANFLRQFGLSIEDLSLLSLKGGVPDVRRTTGQLLARAHPAIATPIKMWTGEDPYTGRPIKQMHPLTGVQALDTLAYASPLSRAIGTVQMLADERRKDTLGDLGLDALNLLTGVKVGTYDLPRQKLYALQRANESIIEADPLSRSFEQLYVPKAKQAEARPETLQALEMNKRLTRLIRKMLDEEKEK